MTTTTANMEKKPRARYVRGTIVDRAMAKLRYDSGCWTWTGCTVRGYARIMQTSGVGSVVAHVVVYEALVGPVPEGMMLDHLCRNRACCNPLHLEPVTFAENVRRGAAAQSKRLTHCPAGHEYTDENVRLRKGKYRTCRTCDRQYTQAKRAELR